MRKRLVLIVLMLALVLVVTPGQAQAQRTATTTYTVQADDTLYGLAGKNLKDANAWEKIYQANPFLHERGRRFDKDGRTIVLLHPGEQLAGLNQLGILSEPLPDLQKELKGETVVKEVVPNWVWIFLVMTIALILFMLWLSVMMRRDDRLREEELNRDPVTSGPAVVPRGVTDATAPTHFQDMAARRYTEATGRPTQAQLFEVLRSIPGRIWGRMNVSYADGRAEERRLSGQRAYQAEVRFPDGNMETLYMLQACGNDLRYEGVNRYTPGDDFRFEADIPAATAPERVTQDAASPAATQVPVPEIPATAHVVEEGVVRLEIRKGDGDQKAMIRMTGVDETADNTCELEAGVVTFRYTPRNK